MLEDQVGGFIEHLRALRADMSRSEEHTSELQSRSDLVCRLLLAKNNAHPAPAVDLAQALSDRIAQNLKPDARRRGNLRPSWGDTGPGPGPARHTVDLGSRGHGDA